MWAHDSSLQSPRHSLSLPQGLRSLRRRSPGQLAERSIAYIDVHVRITYAPYLLSAREHVATRDAK